MAKSSGYVYRGTERSVEGVARRAKQATGSYDSYIKGDFPQLKVKEGEVTFRILPPTWEDVEKWGDSWEIQIWLHYNVGADGGAYLCLDKMSGKRCPVCEARAESSDDEERDAMRPSWRGIAWALDRDNEKAGPQVWNFAGTLFRDINARSIDKKTNEVILLDDPEEGYDLMFDRQGNDKKTKYTGVEVSRDPSPVHDNAKMQERWLDYIMDHPLPDVLQFYDYDYIFKVLSGRAKPKVQTEDDGTGDEIFTPSRSSSRRVQSDGEEETTSRRGRRNNEPEPDEEVEVSEPRSSRLRRTGTAEHESEGVEETTTSRSNGRRRPSRESEEETEVETRPNPRASRRAVVSEAPEDAADPPERQARRGLERLRRERA